jgi:hypothetical protein
VQRLPLRRVTGFWAKNGEWRDLQDPDGPPTPRQLLALWHAGALVITRTPDPCNQFAKSEAAWAIDWATDRENA